jgi:hypothetical protein
MRPSRWTALTLAAVTFSACAEGTHPQGLDRTDAVAGSERSDMLTDEQFQSLAEQSGLSAQALQDLAAARRATARFHQVEVVMAEGWPRDFTGCLDFPEGYMGFGPGAMGHHYINPAVYNDGGLLDPTRPEAVLYETQPDGSLRLTALEYIIPESARPRTDPPPVLFGREMMFHPQFGVWGLHVWLWRPNPYGLFADVNPRVGCEFAD